jgi:hypothetical protein
VANYNLRRLEAAEKSVRSAQRLDTRHAYPQIGRLLGDILALNRQYAEAAGEFRQYLELAPEAADAPAVRQKLEDAEKRAVETTQTQR